jgi:alpha-N-arabinofuranosidase
MANIAQIVNVLQSVILTNGPEMVKTPTYHVFKMYSVHQDARLIPVSLETERYTYKEESIPAITGSASEKDGIVSITLTNANPNKSVTIDCNVGNQYKSVSGKIVTGKEMTAYNDFGKEEKVTVSEFMPGKIKNGVLKIEIPPFSVVLVQLQ